ncbi:sepiapterin reductase-like isoform X2 [Tachypleus tridentatus]|uniref:sepiapterin reductase-like isoform X2 n=1 Tax=Tachypleus tridentatus TaxID=6853 RepID=UPI003FD0785C
MNATKVNWEIPSLCVITGASRGLGKAARDMYFKVLAQEDPSLNVICYGPGPLETDMMKDILEHAFPEVRAFIQKLSNEGKVLKCETTVARLFTVLEEE